MQTCRGSHTHTLVEAPDDPANVYIYVQGTAGVRPATELAGCDANNTNTPTGENPSKWRIEVIKVPLANPAGGRGRAPSRACSRTRPARSTASRTRCRRRSIRRASNWGPTPITDACHDITVYEELDLAAGACEGNGLLIDISDPAHPTRLDAVADPLYAYWHGATFSNDGKTVVFTDEWGGGTGARCRATDDLSWGGDAIYDIVDGKLAVPQLLQAAGRADEPGELRQPHPVARAGSRPRPLRPGVVPGRRVARRLQRLGESGRDRLLRPRAEQRDGARAGGLWSTYWYNGVAYGSEIGRGFDVYGLTPIAGQLTQNEIDAAREVTTARLNVQNQQHFVNQPSFAVVRSYVDQLVRADDIDADTLARVTKGIDRAERFQTGPQATAAKANLRALANSLKNRGDQYAALRDTLWALGSK